MKPINSSTRTMSLIGLSIFLHGAVFWTVAENVSLHKVAQIIEETHEQANRSELWEKVSARNQSVEVDLAETGEKAPAIEIKEEAQEEAQQKKSPEKKSVKKDFTFKKVESVATVLPEKEKTETVAQNSPEPKQTVDVGAAVDEDMDVKLVPVSDSLDGVVGDTDKTTEAKADIETIPQELKEVENTDLLSELNESEPSTADVRSYLSLRQASGNQPPQYPLEARKQGMQGRVVLKYFVTEEGAVKDISVEESSGFETLDNEAIRAISSYRYYPGQSGWAEHPVKFTLNQNLGAARSN